MMKKSVWISSLILVLIFSCVLFAQTYVLKVKVQVANVRMEPDTNSAVVKKIPLGTLLESNNKLGDWYEIVIADDEGNAQSAYIHHMVVDIIAGETRQPEQPAQREIPRPSQTQPRPVPSFGDYPQGGFKVLGGLVSANISTSDVPVEGLDINDFKKSKLGFFGGVGYEIGGRLSFEANVLYMQKGVKYEGAVPQDVGEGVQGNFSVTSNMNVISVPLLIKYRIMPGNTPYFFGGGEFSLIMSNDVDYEFTDPDTGVTISGSEDAKDGTQDFDYGLVFGAGFEMNKFSIPIFFEVRYHMGLADIAGTDENFPQVQDTDSVKTSALVLLVGVRF